MSSLDRAFIDDLLSRIDIIEVIGNVIQLKKHGNGYKGLCPFHSENTPSFNVSNTKAKPSTPGDGSNTSAGDEVYADHDCWNFCDHAIWFGFVFGCWREEFAV